MVQARVPANNIGIEGTRPHVLTIRVTPEQKADLMTRASAAGMTMSDFVRNYLAMSFKEANNIEERVGDLERRLSQLEELAGF